MIFDFHVIYIRLSSYIFTFTYTRYYKTIDDYRLCFLLNEKLDIILLYLHTLSTDFTTARTFIVDITTRD